MIGIIPKQSLLTSAATIHVTSLQRMFRRMPTTWKMRIGIPDAALRVDLQTFGFEARAL